MRILLVFVDGLGIGANDPASNPLVAAPLPMLSRLCGGSVPHRGHKRHRSPSTCLFPVNATLGMPGLPQSGTGQTAIFTGVNGPKLFGKHFGPYPPSTLRPVIEQKNIFRQLMEQGKTVAFANAFPRRFFEYTETGTRRLSVTTIACQMSGLPLRTAEDLARDEGISADFTRAKWGELGHPDVLPTTPRESGHHFWDIARTHDFTLFEYWLTDHAGHSQRMDFAAEVLVAFDEFLGGLFERFDPRDSLFLLISDHGNIEDLSKKSHTRNQVPCIAAGLHCEAMEGRIRHLTHITPTIVDLLTA